MGFGHLLLFSSILLGAVSAVVGVLVPFVIQRIQSQSFKEEAAKARESIKTEMEELKKTVAITLKAEISAELLNTINEKIAEKSKDLSKEIMRASAGVWLLQSNSSIKDENYNQATIDVATSARFYLSSEDELNGRNRLETLVKTCLPKLNRESFSEESEVESELKALLKWLESNNEHDRYTEIVRQIRTAIVKAKRIEKSDGKKKEP